MRVFGIILIFLSACAEPDLTPETNYFPNDFPTLAENQTALNKEIIDLGKQLFFDQHLSANGEVSCASCHLPEMSFTDGEALASNGVSGNQLERHSPALVNLAYMDNGLFWDGGAKNLESLVFAPLTHPDEMGADLEEVNNYLAKGFYESAIKSAFKVDEVKVQYAAKAIAQYLKTLVSDQSKYDSMRRGLVNFNNEEQKGYELFKANCSSCHTEPLLTDNSFHNNGLDASFDTADESLHSGRYRISHKVEDIGKFKTPTLRNVVITAPYMHDGRFKSLDQVLNHYQNGINNSATLDPLLINDNSLGIAFTTDEKASLMAFLQTLTDSSFTKQH
ncbi:cytochrome c peroxidase [Marivirga atlantica]|uniref:cytochrome-c peroxidase n=1 Tax=Marivirga atlantica TaxID=1548457 RepID=UPI001F01CD19|nr:cytochrome c peroxidase [Marivirga atlantica]